MQKEFITTDFKQTQKLGELLAKEINLSAGRGKIICLSGDLGTGKTTFTQGLLKGLKVKGPYTSPTFVIMKKYSQNIFHIDAYRVGTDDIKSLGWEEIANNPRNIVIIEWAEKICGIIPKKALWIEFQWISEKKRKIIFR
jgi:tRNA threonylcarbamoyladenosine biosynthesis protein TsaE